MVSDAGTRIESNNKTTTTTTTPINIIFFIFDELRIENLYTLERIFRWSTQQCITRIKYIPVMINSSHWAYLAEGKTSIVFAYEGPMDSTTRNDIQFDNQVIRVSKLDDIHSDKSDLFSFYVLTPWYSPLYLTESKLLTLEFSSIYELLTKSLPKRPPGRVAGIPISNTLSEKVVYLQPNLHLHVRPKHEFLRRFGYSSNCVVSLEMKVKCGLKSLSPFVNHANSIKFLLGRYSLMQFFKQWECDHDIQCEWGKFTSMSNYDPSELCSRERSKVTRALNDLLENPQNNLRVSLNGEHAYGWHCQRKQNLVSVFSNIKKFCSNFGNLIFFPIKLLN